MKEKQLPNSCIECPKADCTGYCKILNDRQEDYALTRHKDCPLEGEDNGREVHYRADSKCSHAGG